MVCGKINLFLGSVIDIWIGGATPPLGWSTGPGATPPGWSTGPGATPPGWSSGPGHPAPPLP